MFPSPARSAAYSTRFPGTASRRSSSVPVAGNRSTCAAKNRVLPINASFASPRIPIRIRIPSAPPPAECEQCERSVNKRPICCHGFRALRIYWCRHPNGSCKVRNPFLPFLLFFPEPQPRLSFFGSSLPAPFVRPYVQVQRLMKLLQEREERFDQYLRRERK